MLLSKAWEKYEADKRIEGFSPQTLKAYKLQSILLIRFFKDVELQAVTTDKLKAYLAKSSESLKPAVWLIAFGLSNHCFDGHMKKDISLRTPQLK